MTKSYFAKGFPNTVEILEVFFILNNFTVTLWEKLEKITTNPSMFIQEVMETFSFKLGPYISNKIVPHRRSSFCNVLQQTYFYNNN